MGNITLKSQTKNGTPLTAVFSPERGMNLISYKRGEVEVMAQSTKDLFDERNAGLGAMIAPHFHRRDGKILDPVKDPSLFPHLKKMKDGDDPFSHGIARYVAWKAESTENSVSAKLSGSDEWKGVALKELEGQDFHLTYDAELDQDGLHIEMSVRSDTDSLVGIHYYYTLPKGDASVTSHVKPFYMDQGEKKEIPSSWSYTTEQLLTFNLSQEADYTFHPVKDPSRGAISLKTEQFTLNTTYETGNQENCWQLWHPKDASFVCIEPISAQNPKKPILTVSQIKIDLQIFEG